MKQKSSASKGPKGPRIISIKNYWILGVKSLTNVNKIVPKRPKIISTKNCRRCALWEECQVLILKNARNCDSLTSEFHSRYKRFHSRFKKCIWKKFVWKDDQWTGNHSFLCIRYISFCIMMIWTHFTFFWDNIYDDV